MGLQLINDRGIQGALELKDQIKVTNSGPVVSVEEYLTEDRFSFHGTAENRLYRLTLLTESLSTNRFKSSFTITQAVIFKARMTSLGLDPLKMCRTVAVRGNTSIQLVERIHETIRNFCKTTPCWTAAQIYEFNEALGNPLPSLSQMGGKTPKAALLYLPSPEANQILKFGRTPV